MTCDDRGRLAVADSHNRCIKLFDMESLEYICKFGNDKFNCATGFTYDDVSGNGYGSFVYFLMRSFDF